MKLYDNPLYMEDVIRVGQTDLPWEKLKSRTIVISGATGLLGSFLIDVILEKNVREKLDCTVVALCRNVKTAEERFEKYLTEGCIRFVPYDAGEPIAYNANNESVDYVLHFASNTHPLQYATDPIGTIATNVMGLKNILDFAAEHHAIRVVFASSNEIYGENRGDAELFDEKYCGYIDSNTLRAGYPESKRCGEALCQAYIAQKGLDVVIPRFTRSYGPTMKLSDSKVVSQFIKKGINGEDVVLKSEGNQFYSFTYVADAISGFLTVLFKGKTGEAYNIADASSDIRLRDLAEIVAEINGKKVIFDIPDSVEATGYSKATKARLEGSKLQALGWKAQYGIRDGIERTIRIMRE